MARRVPIHGEPHFSSTCLPRRAYIPCLTDDGISSSALVLDVHPFAGEDEGLSSYSANRWFRRARQILENYFDDPSTLLVVIHGYRGGTAWKKAIVRHFPSPNVIYPTLNPGVTVVECNSTDA